MGSEQSAQTGTAEATVAAGTMAPPRAQSGRLARGHTIPIPGQSRDGGSETTPSVNTSPGASVCSDLDIPYISYTLNRPIGDSPKMSGRGQTKRGGFQQKRFSAPHRAASVSSAASAQLVHPAGHNIVVVKEAKRAPASDKDEDVLRLQQIPMFLPIMRGTLGLPGARDPEVLEGIDSSPWLRLCGRYQTHLAANARTVAGEQGAITAKCKEVDAEVIKIHAAFVERQKRGAQAAERLSHIKHVSQQLTRCHDLMEQLIVSSRELNDALPPDLRLEPFRVSPD